MSKHIDRQNYEEFYLDYLEGNLSGEVLAAFEAFLTANPDLVIDGELETIRPTEETLDPAIKLALKHTTEMSRLSAETLDYFLIAREEGLLNGEQSSQLENWLNANAHYRNDARLMQLAKLMPSAHDVYTSKNDLKRPTGRIIPLPVWIGSAAAAAGLAFFLLFSDGTPQINAGPANPLAQQETRTSKDDGSGNSGTTQTALPSAETPVEDGTIMSGNRMVKQTFTESAPVVDQLAMRPVEKGNTNSTLVPLHIDEVIEGNLPTALSDLAIAATPVSAKPDMANPIVPITDRLSAALNTEVDFRTAKAAKRKGGGFYLKIGKFEVSHRSASR